MMGILKCILKSGGAVNGQYAEDEYEDLYQGWTNKRDFLSFRNCEIKTSEIAAIIWKDKIKT